MTVTGYDSAQQGVASLYRQSKTKTANNRQKHYTQLVKTYARHIHHNLQ